MPAIVGGVVDGAMQLVIPIGLVAIVLMGLAIITGGQVNLLGAFTRLLILMMSGATDVLMTLVRGLRSLMGSLSPRAWAVIAGLALVVIMVRQLGVWAFVLLGVVSAVGLAALTVQILQRLRRI